jgi:N-acetyl-anhydromuramyl-L-alanine amidase AmpD
LKPEYILIHHSLTKDGKVVDWNAIFKYHTEELGWNDIGYHYGIERIGNKYAVLTGRPENVVGAHTKQNRMNYKSLGICVVGNYDNERPPEIVMDLLVDKCVELCLKYDIPSSHIKAHHDYASYKTCPGKMFPMSELIERVQNRLYKLGVKAC